MAAARRYTSRSELLTLAGFRVYHLVWLNGLLTDSVVAMLYQNLATLILAVNLALRCYLNTI